MCPTMDAITYLDSGFGEVGLHSDLFAGVDVRVMRLLEGALQFLELSRRECGSDPPLLPLLGEHPVVSRGIHLVRQACVRQNIDLSIIGTQFEKCGHKLNFENSLSFRVKTNMKYIFSLKTHSCLTLR